MCSLVPRPHPRGYKSVVFMVLSVQDKMSQITKLVQRNLTKAHACMHTAKIKWFV